MGTTAQEVWKLGAFTRLRKAWGCGDSVGRLFAAAIVVEPIIGLVILLPTIFSSVPPGEIAVILLNGLMALVAQAVFLPAQYAVAMSPRFWRTAIAEGWMPSFEREYYAELSRYRETFGGSTGRLPGESTWAAGGTVVYLVTVAVAALGTPIIYPSLHVIGVGVFAIFEVPVALGFFILYARFSRKEMNLASERGYPLMKLKMDVNRALRERAMTAKK